MNEFFSIIFNWLSSFYGQDWDNFLYDQGYYSYLGLILVVFAVLFSAIFYFTPTARFNGRGKWFIFMAIMAILIFLSTFGVSDFWANNATEDELPEEALDVMDEIGTSVISVIWGIVTYFLLSLAMMKISTYNKYVPFK